MGGHGRAQEGCGGMFFGALLTVVAVIIGFIAALS